MPKWLHDKLAKAGKKHGFAGKNLKKYIHGAMQNLKKRKKRKRKSKKLARPGK